MSTVHDGMHMGKRCITRHDALRTPYGNGINKNKASCEMCIYNYTMYFTGGFKI